MGEPILNPAPTADPARADNQPTPFVIPPTHMLGGTDHEYRRDWQDESRNDRRIT